MNITEIRLRLEASRNLYKTIAGYMALPEWTPAMGALLVCGIEPPKDCIEIPARSHRLDSEMLQASGSALDNAKEILEFWREEQAELLDDNDALESKMVQPWGFIIWCLDSVPDLATWLPYFVEERGKTDPPEIINPAIIELALSMLESVERFSPAQIQPVYEPTPPSAPRFNGELAEVLSEAIRRATDPKAPRSVFQALIELARSEKPPYPLLKYDDAKRAVIWGYTDPKGDVKREFTIEDMRSRIRSVKAK